MNYETMSRRIKKNNLFIFWLFGLLGLTLVHEAMLIIGFCAIMRRSS